MSRFTRSSKIVNLVTDAQNMMSSVDSKSLTHNTTETGKCSIQLVLQNFNK